MRIVIFFGPLKFPVEFSRGELWLQFPVYSPSRCSCGRPRNSPPALGLRFPVKGTPYAL